MKTQTAKMYNEKPSKLSNIGQDVAGACRHNFDTYNNPEARAERARVKKLKDNKKDIKARTLSLLSDPGCDFVAILCAHEMALIAEKLPEYHGDINGSKEAMDELRTFVRSKRPTGASYDREESTKFNDMVNAFNRLNKLINKIRWSIRSLEDAQKYMEPKTKNQFKEFNGVEKPWSLEPGCFSPSAVEKLANVTRAVQFGNSLTLEEREYCIQNLHDSIELLNQHYNFDFKSLAFSFGARGRAGSIAHYQDSQKVLAFNRGWIGAFIHELGHAVDYGLGKVSKQIPCETVRQYRKKLSSANVGPFMSYYMTPTEIFARLFEVYLRNAIPEMSAFMQVTFDESVMPDLDALSHEWMKGILSGLAAKEDEKGAM